MAVTKARFAKLRTVDGATVWDEEIRIIRFINDHLAQIPNKYIKL